MRQSLYAQYPRMMVGLDANGNPLELVVDAAGNMSFAHAAGERHADNSAISFVVVRDGVPNLAIIGKTTAVTIGGGVAADTNLKGLRIYAALTGTCVITGFADSDGTATSITLPAATPAGFVDFCWAVNSAGALTITCSNVADDNLVAAFWLPA